MPSTLAFAPRPEDMDEDFFSPLPPNRPDPAERAEDDGVEG